jgi:hypothetical protein
MAEPAADPKKTNSNGNGNGTAAAAFYDAELASHWNNLPSSARAAKILGISLARLNALIRDGNLQAYSAPDGTRRFKPIWLEEFKRECEELPDDEEESSAAADKKAAREGIPAEAIRATAELLKASQRQNLELHELVLKGFKAATEAQDITIQRLQGRNERYESIIEKLLQAREDYFDAQLERDMLRQQQQAASERRSQLFEMAKANAGDLFDILKKKFGVDDVTSKKLSAAVELLSGLNPQQIEVAAMMGFFTPDQMSLIEQIIGKKINANSAPKNTQNKAEAAGSSPAASAEPAKAGESEQPK